jgi:hypothetical protein
MDLCLATITQKEAQRLNTQISAKRADPLHDFKKDNADFSLFKNFETFFIVPRRV